MYLIHKSIITTTNTIQHVRQHLNPSFGSRYSSLTRVTPQLPQQADSNCQRPAHLAAQPSTWPDQLDVAPSEPVAPLYRLCVAPCSVSYSLYEAPAPSASPQVYSALLRTSDLYSPCALCGLVPCTAIGSLHPTSSSSTSCSRTTISIGDCWVERR